jgi:hypothetical protein
MGLLTEAKFIVLEGIESKNRFYTMNCSNEDQTKLLNGTVAYTILGYANSEKEALDIIGDDEYHRRTMNDYISNLLKTARGII